MCGGVFVITDVFYQGTYLCGNIFVMTSGILWHEPMAKAANTQIKKDFPAASFGTKTCEVKCI